MIGMGAVGYEEGEKEKGTIRRGEGGGGQVEGQQWGQCGGAGGGGEGKDQHEGDGEEG